MPDARCTRGPVCKMGKGSAHEHTGSAENIRHSLRNGFTAYTRSPRRRIRLVTVVGELTASPRPVGPTRLRQLDTSNGCRNHTTSPYATTPFVCTPCDRSRVWLNPKPALPFTCAPDAAASTASRPASLTIRIRPSVGRDGKGYRFESGQAKTEIFLQKGLDGDPNQHRVRHRCRGQHQHQAVRRRSPRIPQAAIAAINSEISTL
jgi:hypothetical protein